MPCTCRPVPSPGLSGVAVTGVVTAYEIRPWKRAQEARSASVESPSPPASDAKGASEATERVIQRKTSTATSLSEPAVEERAAKPAPGYPSYDCRRRFV